MSIPSIEPLPPEDASLPPARRRRQQRRAIPPEAGERAAYLEELVHQVTPSLDFFLLALLTGAVLVVAILSDSPTFYVAAALLAPFLSPLVGLGVGALVGMGRFFLQELASMLIALGLVFIAGMIAGGISLSISEFTSVQALYHLVFSLPDLLVVTLGASALTFTVLRSPQQRALIASVALAYEIFLPLAVAGFGLAVGNLPYLLDGLVVSMVHLGWAILVCMLIAAFMGLRPLNSQGYLIPAGMLGILAVALILLGQTSASLNLASSPTPLPTPMPTTAPTVTRTFTPSPEPSFTPSPSATPTPRPTATPSPSPTPTPVIALVNGGEALGVNVREEPNISAVILAVLNNGTPVEVLAEKATSGGQSWTKIRYKDKEGVSREGWVIERLLVFPTAIPFPTVTGTP